MAQKMTPEDKLAEKLDMLNAENHSAPYQAALSLSAALAAIRKWKAQVAVAAVVLSDPAGCRTVALGQAAMGQAKAEVEAALAEGTVEEIAEANGIAAPALIEGAAS